MAPKYLKYSTESARLTSFDDCGDIMVLPKHLTTAGFFYAGFGDLFHFPSGSILVDCHKANTWATHWKFFKYMAQCVAVSKSKIILYLYDFVDKTRWSESLRDWSRSQADPSQIRKIVDSADQPLTDMRSGLPGTASNW